MLTEDGDETARMLSLIATPVGFGAGAAPALHHSSISIVSPKMRIDPGLDNMPATDAEIKFANVRLGLLRHLTGAPPHSCTFA